MPVDPDSVELLRRAVARAKRSRSVRLPISFARGTSAPLQELVRGGRGGEVRLKLYLTIVMRATAKPYTVPPTPASSYARLLGLDDAEVNGARRVNAAISWLKGHDLITCEGTQGVPPKVTVVDLEASRGASARYITIPIELWSQGWILRLSGRALALYVILRELTGGRGAAGATADRARKADYGLSDETWARACKELEDAGLAFSTPVVEGVEFGLRRRRLRYRLVDGSLSLPA